MDWIALNNVLAAWVQAIGTLIALGLAIYLPWKQRRDVEKTTALALRLPLRIVWNACRPATTYIQAGVANTPARDKHLRAIAHAEATLSHISFQNLPNDCADFFQEIRDTAAALAEILRERSIAEEFWQEDAYHQFLQMNFAMDQIFKRAPASRHEMTELDVAHFLAEDLKTRP